MVRIDRRHVHSALTMLLLAAASNAFADPEKCQRTIADASGKFQKDKSSALQKCEDKKTTGKLPASTVCLSDAKTAEDIQKAATKLQTSIAKDCGGKDKTCGTSDDDSLASIGWDGVTTCPNFENGSCNGPISDCDDIAACITCVDEAAVDQAIDLYYGDLDDSQFGTNSQINKCQRAIGKETVKFLQSKSKALTKCWDERIKGKHANPCPSPGDNKAAAAIQKAEVKKVQNICKACAGPDKACGNDDDLTPEQIGFASSCPDVTVPEGGSSCGGALLDLADVVQCVDCVTEFKVDCTDRLTVPQFATYPPECNPASSTTTSSTTTSSTTTTVVNTCGNGMVDPGEPCDPSSPGGAFSCAPGETCSEICTCLPPTTTTLEPTTTSTTTSSTTTTVVNTCGNGMVDPGEPCDPSSPGGSFTCAPGEVCSEICTCIPTTTTTLEPTTTTVEPTTTTTSTSSTSTTVVNTCGNGMVDPGEPCDPSSPGGSFTCAPGEVCSEICTCIPTTTTTLEPTTTTAEPTTTTTSTSTTSTTVVNTCGNGMVDPGEPCDLSSPGGSFTCAPGEECSPVCTCVGVSTTTTSSAPPTTLEPTTTTEAPTTSTTEEPTTSSTTTSTTSSTTTTLYGSPSRAFLSSVGGLLD